MSSLFKSAFVPFSLLVVLASCGEQNPFPAQMKLGQEPQKDEVIPEIPYEILVPSDLACVVNARCSFVTTVSISSKSDKDILISASGIPEGSIFDRFAAFEWIPSVEIFKDVPAEVLEKTFKLYVLVETKGATSQVVAAKAVNITVKRN